MKWMSSKVLSQCYVYCSFHCSCAEHLASLVSQARLFTLATTTTSKLKKIINITGEEIEEGVVEDVKKPSAFPIAEKRI